MTIHIEDLSFKCIIGLLEFERHNPQELLVNLELDYDYTNENEFINYADLAELIKVHLQEEKYELLETALENLFDTIYKKHPAIKRLNIKITKPDILHDCRVSVSNIKIF